MEHCYHACIVIWTEWYLTWNSVLLSPKFKLQKLQLNSVWSWFLFIFLPEFLPFFLLVFDGQFCLGLLFSLSPALEANDADVVDVDPEDAEAAESSILSEFIWVISSSIYNKTKMEFLQLQQTRFLSHHWRMHWRVGAEEAAGLSVTATFLSNNELYCATQLLPRRRRMHRHQRPVSSRFGSWNLLCSHWFYTVANAIFNAFFKGAFFEVWTLFQLQVSNSDWFWYL